jgi:hypothetical protein
MFDGLASVLSQFRKGFVTVRIVPRGDLLFRHAIDDAEIIGTASLRRSVERTVQL